MQQKNILKTKGRRVSIGISHTVVPFRFIKFVILENPKGNENILIERIGIEHSSA